MYSILRGLLSFLKPHPVNVDNFPFRLHYQLTSLFLITASVLVTLKQFFGDPIDCFTSNTDDIPKSYLNIYCWMQSTFIIPASLGKRLGIDVAAPGIEKYTDQDRIYMKYYQWVCFFLVFQAICFYLPRFLWKSMEGGKILQITEGLHNPFQNLDDKHCKIQHLASYITDKLGGHRIYALGYYVCEALNFINVVCQIYITNTFLGGEFLSYGSDVLSFAQTDQENRYNPMIRVFPRVSKCSINKFGPSGDVQQHDALCVLSLNIINEKIFVFSWFWFVTLAVISGSTILYRIIWLSFHKLRYQTLLKSNSKTIHVQLSHLTQKFGFGDWFFMHLLRKNINSLHFRDLVAEIDRILECGGNANTTTTYIPQENTHRPGAYLEKV